MPRDAEDHPFAFYERKYRSDQPRVPAGNADGRRWTAGDAGGGSQSPANQPTTKPPPINDPRVISDATPDNDWKPGAQYAQVEMGQLVAEIPVAGGRRCVYKFGAIAVVVPGPVNFRCPPTTPLAGTTHGYLLNDNWRR